MTISARNYAAQAQVDLIKYAEFLKKKGSVNDASDCLSLAKDIGESVKFSLPNGGRLLNDGLRGLITQRLNLPFDKICVEFFSDDSPFGKKRVIFAKELNFDEAITIISQSIEVSEKANVDIMKMNEGSNHNFIKAATDSKKYILVRGTVNSDHARIIPSPFSALVTSDWYEEYAPEQKNAIGIKLLPISLQENIINENVENINTDVFLSWVSSDIGAVLELCEALSCSNIAAESIGGLKRELNKKHAAKRKLPFYDTKVLTIKAPIIKKDNKKRNAGNGVSPRQHLRRGHIRRLADRNIWVNACVVGSQKNGVINKSYRITS